MTKMMKLFLEVRMTTMIMMMTMTMMMMMMMMITYCTTWPAARTMLRH